MSFMMFPPEFNSGLMYSGAGSGPLMAAASAWDELAADLEATAASYQTVLAAIDRDDMVGSDLGADGCGHGALRGLAGRLPRVKPPRPRLRPGLPPLPTRVRSRDGSACGDRRQPSVVGGVGGHQLPGPEHAGDRGHRGAIHGDVVPGRHDDGHLRDGLPAGRRVACSRPRRRRQAMAGRPPMPPRRLSRSELRHQPPARTLATDLQSAAQCSGRNPRAHRLTAVMGSTSLGDCRRITGTLQSRPRGRSLTHDGCQPTAMDSILPVQATYYATMLASMPAKMLISLSNSMGCQPGDAGGPTGHAGRRHPTPRRQDESLAGRHIRPDAGVRIADQCSAGVSAIGWVGCRFRTVGRKRPQRWSARRRCCRPTASARRLHPRDCPTARSPKRSWVP